MALYRLPLFLLILIAIVPLFTASASHSQLSPEHAAARRRHHTSPATACAATVQFHPATSATSSMPQNHLGMEHSPSPLEATAGNPHALPVPPQAATPPPPPQAPALLLQEDSDSEGSSSASASPSAAASTTTTTLLPLLNQRAAAASASSASPVQAGVARVVGWGSEEGLLRWRGCLRRWGTTRWHRRRRTTPTYRRSRGGTGRSPSSRLPTSPSRPRAPCARAAASSWTTSPWATTRTPSSPPPPPSRFHRPPSTSASTSTP
ncbi:hypothetical protein VPH35_014225 [Triticum aestivum]